MLATADYLGGSDGRMSGGGDGAPARRSAGRLQLTSRVQAVGLRFNGANRRVEEVRSRHAACGLQDMDDVTKAKLQVRLVVATYRQQISRNAGNGDAAAAFRERAWPLLDSVELAYASEPEVVQVLAEARRELESAAG